MIPIDGNSHAIRLIDVPGLKGEFAVEPLKERVNGGLEELFVAFVHRRSLEQFALDQLVDHFRFTFARPALPEGLNLVARQSAGTHQEIELPWQF